jgi:hypothetical protein
MKPVVPKIAVPTMLEITSAVALKKPSWRNSPAEGIRVEDELSELGISA